MAFYLTGIHTPHRKNTIKTPTVKMDIPKTVSIPMSMHIGKAAVPTVKVGDTVVARKGAVVYTYKVLQLIDKRQGAKLVPNYAENLTPQEELAKLRAPVETFFLKRDRGAGRPTKKDRRQMEELWDSMDFDVPEDIAEMFFDAED